MVISIKELVQFPPTAQSITLSSIPTKLHKCIVFIKIVLAQVE